MSIVTISFIVGGFIVLGGLGLLGLVIILALVTGKKPKALGGVTLTPFEREVQEALAVDNAATLAKAKAYDLAKKQALLDEIRAIKP